MKNSNGTMWEPGRLFQTDSFTDKPFKGNSAGVVFCGGSENDEWMQNMAFEMNLSETAFLTPGEDIFHIRYFTPTNEVLLCGHATLASAHVLFEQGFTLAVAGDESQILNSLPRFDRLEEYGLGDLLITAESLRDDSDFVLRCFCPAHGINEDPVTGSAHCALVPFWHGKTGKNQFVSRQLSRRTGTIHTRLEGDRVIIRGQAVTIFEVRYMAGSVLTESN